MERRLEKLEEKVYEHQKFINSLQGNLITVNKHIGTLQKVMLDNKLVSQEELDNLIRGSSVQIGNYIVK